MTNGTPSTAAPQINFSLGNPGAANVIYISSDPTANQLTLVLTPTVAAGYTPGELVQVSDAPANSGSILFLDLTALSLDPAVFAALKLEAEGWTSKPFVDALTGQNVVAFTPGAAVPNSGAPISFSLTGFALATAPQGSVSLDLIAFNVDGIVSGELPAESGCPVSFAAPPGKKEDLRKVLSATITPVDVVVSQQGYPSVSNSLTLTLAQIGSVAIPADENTVFTLSVVYASDANGFGALLTTAEGARISIPVPGSSNWTTSNVDGVQGRSWQLTPPAGPSILDPEGDPLDFAFTPVVSQFQPGATVVLLSYKGVPGYADGAFPITVQKQPHVRIDGPLKVSPALSTLQNKEALITVSWDVANAVRLVLSPLGGDVSNTQSFQGTVEKTTALTLTAYGAGSGDADNIAIANATATVIPVLNSFAASPGAVSVDDFGGGGADVTLNWAVNIQPSAQLELSSSATGKFGTRFGPVGNTIPPVTTPQMFTLNVVDDTRPEDFWRIYVPAFKLVACASGSAQGAWPVAAPGASYVAVSQAAANCLSILSTASYSRIAAVPTGASPQGLAISADGSRIYVANGGDGTISVINVATTNLQPPWSFTAGTAIHVGGAPSQVALAPSDYLFATIANGSSAGSLAVVTLANGAVAQVGVGVGPSGLAVTPSGAQVFVANQTDGTVSQIGIAPDGSAQLIRTLGNLPGAAAVAVTPDGNVLLVACSDGTVQLLDATAPDTSVRTPVQIGGQPAGIALDPSGCYAFVVTGAGQVSIVNIIKQAVIGQPVQTGPAPEGISVSPDGLLVLIGQAAGLGVLSLSTYTPRSAAPQCGGYVTDVAVSADSSRAFVWSNAESHYRGHQPAPGVQVYDVASETLTPALPEAKIITLIAPRDGGTAGFLTQSGQSAVYPFDTGTLALGTPMLVPDKGGFTSRQPLALAASHDGSTVFALVNDGTAANGSFQFSLAVFAAGSSGYTLASDIVFYTTKYKPLAVRLAAAPDGSAAYTYDSGSGNLWAAKSGASGFAVVAQPIEFGPPEAAGLLLSPNGATLYLAGQESNTTTFYVVDTAAWTMTSYPLSEPAYILQVTAIAMSPDGTRILASDGTNGLLRFIDARSLRFLQSVPWSASLSGPEGVAMSPDQTRLFVAGLDGTLNTAIQIRPSPTAE